ncbi:VOC family protein [Allomuricauda sp. M10]|uniref:VOC family protein n=1 Tax=Allomuricauda sp. M10 TaxID=2683292 RepID=UPI001D181B9F|nr:VOC family protein [Muricauda sp. M10]
MENNKINYIEFKGKDLGKIKEFYGLTFGWTFTDYGPEYIAFSNSGLEGGFAQSNETITNGALVVLYHDNLEEIQEKVVRSGGTIVQEIFSFPGGRRFHFTDPSGNELAIWSDK